MTKKEILAMESGRKLDALVEEKLFNHQSEWRYCNWLPEGYYEVQSYGEERIRGGLLDEDELHPCYREGEKWIVTPFYSTDMTDAWKVVEKLCNWNVHDNMLILQGQTPHLEQEGEEDKVGWWEAEINGDWGKVVAEGKTASEAICRAALLAGLKSD